MVHLNSFLNVYVNFFGTWADWVYFSGLVFLSSNYFCTLPFKDCLAQLFQLELQGYELYRFFSFILNFKSIFAVLSHLYLSLQVLTIPLLFTFPLIAKLSGIGLFVVVNIASLLKSILSVSFSSTWAPFSFLVQ